MQHEWNPAQINLVGHQNSPGALVKQHLDGIGQIRDRLIDLPVPERFVQALSEMMDEVISARPDHVERSGGDGRAPQDGWPDSARRRSPSLCAKLWVESQVGPSFVDRYSTQSGPLEKRPS